MLNNTHMHIQLFMMCHVIFGHEMFYIPAHSGHMTPSMPCAKHYANGCTSCQHSHATEPKLRFVQRTTLLMKQFVFDNSLKLTKFRHTSIYITIKCLVNIKYHFILIDYANTFFICIIFHQYFVFNPLINTSYSLAYFTQTSTHFRDPILVGQSCISHLHILHKPQHILEIPY